MLTQRWLWGEHTARATPGKPQTDCGCAAAADASALQHHHKNCLIHEKICVIEIAKNLSTEIFGGFFGKNKIG